MTLAERCVNLLARFLDPEAGEAVLGDLHESRATAWQAARELLLLLLYRQLACWQTSKPWLVLLAVVLPIGILLSQIGRNIGAFAVMQLWTRAHSGGWFHGALPHDRTLIAVACISSAVFLQAWCAGFVAATISRSTLPISACVLALLWLFESLVWPLRSATAWYTLAASFALLIAPSALGMKSGFHAQFIRPGLAIALIGSVTTATALSIWADGWFGKALAQWSSGALPMQPLAIRMWPFVLSALPAFCLLLSLKPTKPDRQIEA